MRIKRLGILKLLKLEYSVSFRPIPRKKKKKRFLICKKQQKEWLITLLFIILNNKTVNLFAIVPIKYKITGFTESIWVILKRKMFYSTCSLYF